MGRTGSGAASGAADDAGAPSRTCKGVCKEFRAKKPPLGGRYDSGQGRCQICDMWISHRGARLKDGSPATPDSVGWWCVCCNFRIRQRPRNRFYKERLRKRAEERGG